MAEIIPLRKYAANPLAYAPGVVPFNRTDPNHIRAWNSLFALGWAEAKRERRHD